MSYYRNRGCIIKGWLGVLSSRVWQQSLDKQPTSAAGRLFHAGGGSHTETGGCRQITCSAMGTPDSSPGLEPEFLRSNYCLWMKNMNEHKYDSSTWVSAAEYRTAWYLSTDPDHMPWLCKLGCLDSEWLRGKKQTVCTQHSFCAGHRLNLLRLVQ